MAILLSNFVWEGTKDERLNDPDVQIQKTDGHIYKELDTGESYIHRGGDWEFINLGLAFIKATKSGNATSDATGDYTVTFNTPFIDNNYSVALTCTDPGGPPGVIAYVVSKTINNFVIKTRNFAGAQTGNTPFSWLATRDYNP
jgi:hypothetical protein